MFTDVGYVMNSCSGKQEWKQSKKKWLCFPDCRNERTSKTLTYWSTIRVCVCFFFLLRWFFFVFVHVCSLSTECAFDYWSCFFFFFMWTVNWECVWTEVRAHTSPFFCPFSTSLDSNVFFFFFFLLGSLFLPRIWAAPVKSLLVVRWTCWHKKKKRCVYLS